MFLSGKSPFTVNFLLFVLKILKIELFHVTEPKTLSVECYQGTPIQTLIKN